MTERERLLDKLEKVRALAERGVGGEKESAERTLAALMERYGITEEDLEDSKTSTHWIRYKTKWEEKLLYQLAYMYLGIGHALGAWAPTPEEHGRKWGSNVPRPSSSRLRRTLLFIPRQWRKKWNCSIKRFCRKTIFSRRRSWQEK